MSYSAADFAAQPAQNNPPAATASTVAAPSTPATSTSGGSYTAADFTGNNNTPPSQPPSTGTNPDNWKNWSPDQPLLSYGAATRGAIGGLVDDTLDAITGAVHFLKPTPQSEGEASAAKNAGPGGMLIYRMLSSMSPVARAAIHPSEIASAIHDINSSQDPVGTYAKIFQKTASQGAGQAVTAIATEGAVKGIAKAAPAIVKAAPEVLGKVKSLPTEVIQGEKVAQPGAQAALRNAPKAASETAAARPTVVMEDANPPMLKVDAEGNPVEVDGQHRAAKLVTAGKGDAPFTINYTDAAGKTTEQEITADQFLKRINRTPEDILATDEQQTGVRAGNGGPRPAAQKFVAKAPTAETPKEIPAGIRTTLADPIKTIEAKGQGIYRQLDEASGGKFQKYSDAIDKINERLDKLIGGVDGEAGIDDDEIEKLEQQKSEVETSQNEMFDTLKQTKGIDKDAVDTANEHWKQARALDDLQRKVFQNPSIVKGNLKYGTAETVNIDPAIKALQKMQDDTRYESSRLEQALGTEGADALLKDMYKAQRDGVHAMKARQWVKYIAIAGGLAGLGGKLLPHAQAAANVIP